MQKLDLIKSSIFESAENANFKRLLAYWQFKDKRIVFTNGCFDIVHLGHVEYLAKAKEEGDILIVGLNSDSSVRRLKGTGRPINDENMRAVVMASLRFVDAVVIFDEDTPYNLINSIQPDVLVKGADYRPEDIVGYDVVMAKGGRVATIELTSGYSTTAIENKIRSKM